MKEYNIHSEPLSFLAILDLQKKEAVNEHGTMTITGYIEDAAEEEYLNMLSGVVWEKVEAVDKDGTRDTLFWGVITDFSVELLNNQKKMTIEITTGSYLMDQRQHVRSFQNKEITYKQIVQSISREYAENGTIFNSYFEDKAGELILQYRETDWNFFKRLASRRNKFFVAESRIKGVKLFYDLPRGREFEFDQNKKYILRKDFDECRKKRGSGISYITESDCLTYVLQDRENHGIGDYVEAHGRKFYVYQIESNYRDGEILHDYYLRQETGLAVCTSSQEKLTGCSLDAIVRSVKEDKVQVAILEDENKQQEITVWYPYATVYSTQDGTGWYCMPEPGDFVRLTIPGEKENQAFVTSSVHMETDSADRKDPAFKTLKTKHQKEVRFTPDSIIITNNKGTKIELTDAEGIHIVSAHSVVLEAAEDITISSDTSSLIVAGSSSVSLTQKGTSINLGSGISFTGGELKVQ